jgi:hypothetical protein
VEAFPKAALFELAAEKSDSPFEQLVACIMSFRGVGPKCFSCPVLDMCRQVGVTKRR